MYYPEADLVNLLGRSQEPQDWLSEDRIIEAIERPHQESLQNRTVRVVLIFHCWINEVGVEENGSTPGTQISSIGKKSFNHSRFSSRALPSLTCSNLAYTKKNTRAVLFDLQSFATCYCPLDAALGANKAEHDVLVPTVFQCLVEDLHQVGHFCISALSYLRTSPSFHQLRITFCQLHLAL